MEKIEKQIRMLVDNCLEAGKKERPENQWMKLKYDRFRIEAGGLAKAEADKYIYRKMYGADPAKASDTLKIRYWRTGRHLPVTREQCITFGRAINLSEKEMKYMIQAYYDRCDYVFEEGSQQHVYLKRKLQMDELVKEYLEKVHPSLKLRLYRFGNNMEHNLRHLYYTDAKSYLKNCTVEEIEVEPHITSINYESEFSRQMKLLGEIPRKTMIRHLLIFSMPFINRELMNKRLELFGYLPLDREHTQVDGSRLDQLLLGVFELYEKYCTGKEPLECVKWFHHMYSVLDHYLENIGNTSLRFLHFKALKESE